MMTNSFRIFLQQPAIPEYLVPLINELCNRLGERFHVETAETHQGTKSSPELLEAVRNGRRNSIRLIDLVELPGRMTWFNTSFKRDVKAGDVFVFAGNPRTVSNYSWLTNRRVSTVWWGQGWGSNTTRLTARFRLALSNLFDVRLFYDELERPLIGDLSRDPTYYINNTIDYSDIDNLIPRRDPTNSFCFVGRLTDKAGAELLPKIAKGLLENQVPNFRIGVIGDGPELPALKVSIEKYGLERFFVFHGAIFDRNQTSRILHNYSYLIYPGAIGLTTQHALSEGMPVITSGNYNRHNPEARLLKDGVNSFFCESSVAGFVDACIRAAHIKKEDYLVMQESCLDIRRTHSISLMADHFISACVTAHQLNSNN